MPHKISKQVIIELKTDPTTKEIHNSKRNELNYYFLNIKMIKKGFETMKFELKNSYSTAKL